MTTRNFAAAVIAASVSLSLATASPARAQAAPASQESAVTTHASGTFEVKLAPLAPHHAAEAAPLGRMSIDKEFRGGLTGTSRGEMLAAMTAVEGSAGYVAMERVTGTLDGRTGTFVLQHSGTMSRGAPSLVISVVPDSGTGELAGLAGTMSIEIAGGQHSYTFDYTLPAAP